MTAIILVNYQSYLDTIECVESLLYMAGNNFKIFIIDNSEDKSMQHKFISSMESLINSVRPSETLGVFESSEYFSINVSGPMVSLINAKNDGFAAANNIVLNKLMGNLGFKYVWLLNNDTKVPEYAINKFVEQYEVLSKFVKLGLLGCVLVYHGQDNVIQGVGGRYYKFLGTSRHVLDGYKLDQLKKFSHFEIDYPIGASMFTSIEFLNEVGLMDERYFIYFEELDWVIRGARKGWVTSYSPEIIIEHKAGQSIGGKNKIKRQSSNLSDYYFYRNRIKFSYRYTPFHFPFVLLTVFITISFRVLKGRASFLKLFFAQKSGNAA